MQKAPSGRRWVVVVAMPCRWGLTPPTVRARPPTPPPPPPGQAPCQSSPFPRLYRLLRPNSCERAHARLVHRGKFGHAPSKSHSSLSHQQKVCPAPPQPRTVGGGGGKDQDCKGSLGPCHEWPASRPAIWQHTAVMRSRSVACMVTLCYDLSTSM